MAAQGVRVLVTGATGFIASHVVRELLAAGYLVRGTVRSLKAEAKFKHLKALPGAAERLELVETNLNDDRGWAEAVRGAVFVQHIASPFIVKVEDEERDLLRPAVDGTRRVLTACAEEVKRGGSLKRVVLTSSIVSIISGHEEDPGHSSHVYTEEDWTNLKGKVKPYPKSKTLAEQAAWDFLKANNPGFELTTINPVYVQGPPLAGGDATSFELLVRLLTRQIPLLPEVAMHIVDVRDVAVMHVRAMTTPGAAGQRFIAHGDSLWIHDVAVILDRALPKQGVPTTRGPKLLFMAVGLCDPTVAEILPSWGRSTQFSTKKAKEVLGIQFTDANTTLVDMANALMDLGVVPRKK